MRDPAQYKIFISYRRDDTQFATDRISEWLVRAFGRDEIFQDVDAVPVAYRFPNFVSAVLRHCRVALIVIGPTWATITAADGPLAGQIRLNDPADYVRQEVEQALALAPVDANGRAAGDLLLIPLLVQGARMPHAEALPESLRELTTRNATTIRRNPGFEEDIKILIATISDWMADPPPRPPPPPPPPPQLTPAQWLHPPNHRWVTIGALVALAMVALGVLVAGWQALDVSLRFITVSALVYGSAVLAFAIWLVALARLFRSRRWWWLGGVLLVGIIPFLAVFFIGGIVPYFYTSIVSLIYGYAGPASQSKPD